MIFCIAYTSYIILQTVEKYQLRKKVILTTTTKIQAEIRVIATSEWI